MTTESLSNDKNATPTLPEAVKKFNFSRHPGDRSTVPRSPSLAMEWWNDGPGRETGVQSVCNAPKTLDFQTRQIGRRSGNDVKRNQVDPFTASPFRGEDESGVLFRLRPGGVQDNRGIHGQRMSLPHCNRVYIDLLDLGIGRTQMTQVHQ